DNNGGCTIDGIPPNYFLTLSTADTATNEELYTATYTGKLDDISCNTTYIDTTVQDFFQVHTNRTHFIIGTTDKLSGIDEITSKQENVNVLISFNCDLSCVNGTSNMQILFAVNDTNNHEPEFLQEKYNYSVAAPIMPSVDFTVYGSAITVKDLDFSNQNEYTAEFRANRVIQVTETVTYTIIAKDSGSPPLNTSKQITIQADPSLSLDTPSFQNPSYSFSYTVVGEKVTLTPLGKAITVNTNKPGSVIDVVLSGDYSKSFTTKFNAADKTISLTATAVSTNSTFIVLTLSLRTDAPASTSVIVYMSEALKPTPKFSSHVYTGKYNDVNNTVVLDENIVVTSSETPVLYLWGIQGFFQNNLRLQYQTEKTDESVVVINLPEHHFQFSNTLYEAKYDATKNTVEVDESIAFTTAADGVTVTYTGLYKDYFNITYDTKAAKCNVVVAKILPTEVLSSGAAITLTISAKDSYDYETNAVLKISVTKMEAPEFSNAYYLAEYPKSGTGFIDPEPAISFTNKNDSSTITIKATEYSDNFNVTFQSNKWRINIKKALNTSILESNTQIVITLEATEKDNTLIGYATLVLELPKTVETTLAFAENYYLAEYPETGSGTIDFKPALNFIGVTNETNIIIVLSDYKDNFSIKKVSGKWQIQILKALTDSVLKDNKELVITMEASSKGFTNNGTSVLVLKLPEIEAETVPEFSEAFYIAKYPKNGTGTVDFDKEIKMENIETGKVKSISLSTYGDNFQVVSESNKWRLKVTKPLNNSILESNSQIVITLEATVEGNTMKGYSALIIDLSETHSEDGPVFSEAFYSASYPETGKGVIKFENPLKFENVADNVEINITLTAYSTHFSITKVTGIWQINILKPLNDSTLNDNKELFITMEASAKGSTKTGVSVLVLKLPELTPPEFSDTYYTADYPTTGSGSISFEKDLSFTNFAAADYTKLQINVSEYSENFDIKYSSTSKKWQININSPLEESVLKSQSVIVLTLIAKETGKAGSGQATLVLNLPGKEAEVGPIFSQPYYGATYQYDAGKPVVVLNDKIEITNKADPTKITMVAIEYPDTFDIKYDATKKIWAVTVESPLSDAILINATDLVISLNATDNENGLSSFSVIRLKLPSVNTEGAPKFSKTYYMAYYNDSDTKPTVAFTEPLVIQNRESLDNITISIDDANYKDYFVIKYNKANKQWTISIKKKLDESILNSGSDLVMGLTATDSTNVKEVGQATLVVTLPKVNSDDAPKFSNIFYETEYVSKSTKLDTEIKITNRDKTALGKITITVDKAYETYFNVSLNESLSIWIVNQIKPLPDAITKKQTNLVVTLTATEDNNTATGKATLVLNFPVQIAPKFSKDQYSGNYTLIDGKPELTVEDIVITNKEDQSKNIMPGFVELTSNFKFLFDDEKKVWTVTLKEPFAEEDLKDKTELVLTLTAQESGNENIGKTTVIISLPQTVEETVEFSQVHYEGTYDDTQNPPKVKLDKIEITSKKNLTKLKLTLQSTDTEAVKYFSLKKTSTHYEIVVEPLPASVLQNQRSLVFTLVADLDGSKSYATLVINLPRIVIDSKIQFSQVLYSGQYEVDSKGNVKFSTDTIAITTTANSTNINVSISADSAYSTYFKAIYNGVNRDVTLTLLTHLPEDVMKTVSFIPLTLVAAVIGTTERSLTVLNLKITNEGSNDTTHVLFAQLLYNGKYMSENQSVIQSGSIKIDTDQADENIEVSIVNEYRTYFKASYAEKLVTVKAGSEQIPPDTLKNLANIPLHLQAKVKNTTHITSAVLNLAVINDIKNDTGTISFNRLLFTGDYTVTDGKVDLGVDKIEIITDRSDDQIESPLTIESEHSEYFRATYANKLVTIESMKRIPDEILNSNTIITLKLVIKVKDSAVTSSAVLNIRLKNNDINKGSVSFAQLLYTGNYTVENGKVEFTVDQEIQVTTNSTDDQIEPRIDSEFADYFEATYVNKIVTVKVAKSLTDDILRSNPFITLKLVINIKDTYISSSAVLNIRLNSNANIEGSISFSSLLFSGTYDITVKPPVIKYDDISIITDQPDNTEVEITNGYKNYFSVNIASKSVTLSITNAIPTDNLKNLTTVAITLTARIKNTSVSSSAVLNLRIIADNTPKTGSVLFAQVLHSGEYSIVDGKGRLKTDSIDVITDTADNEIVPSFPDNSEYSKYFSLTYANRALSVTVKDTLPDDVFYNNTFIFLTLRVGIKETQQISSSVLNIKLNNGRGDDTGSVAFTGLIYNGKYEVKDGKASVSYNPITVETDQEDEKINVTIGTEFESYFTSAYSNKQVTINLKNTDPSSTLLAMSNIPVAITAQIIGTDQSASAVLNMKVESETNPNNTGAVSFAKALYNGKYSANSDGGEAKFYVDNIKLITNKLEGDIELTHANEFEFDKYFKFSLSGTVVSVELDKSIPKDVLKKNTFIPITLTAKIKGTSSSSTAVLNIEINYHSDDEGDTSSVNTTGYIVAIVILALALLGLAGGAGAFYFFKIRNPKYEWDDEDYSKYNSRNTGTSKKRTSALEERRPTGFNFRTEEDGRNESSTDPTSEFPSDRRKSVAFNDKVEKLELDETTRNYVN
ncbi:hypothetical protein JTB14_021973, partial [Gonioctena quinquepunctata]